MARVCDTLKQTVLCLEMGYLNNACLFTKHRYLQCNDGIPALPENSGLPFGSVLSPLRFSQATIFSLPLCTSSSSSKPLTCPLMVRAGSRAAVMDFFLLQPPIRWSGFLQPEGNHKGYLTFCWFKKKNFPSHPLRNPKRIKHPLSCASTHFAFFSFLFLWVVGNCYASISRSHFYHLFSVDSI